MKITYLLLPLAFYVTVAAQDIPDSTDMFSGHLNLREVLVTGAVGGTKAGASPLPVQVVTANTLSSTSSTNLIDAVAKHPGVAQVTTGGAISKPVIRGLGFNRVVVVKDGIRQEGQQWGDEHGIEIDANDVGSVEIFKGPVSLMYGSDAMAGVLVFKNTPTAPLDVVKGGVNAEYQTNNGLAAYSLNISGNNGGFLWDIRYSDKFAHAYRNRYDGFVPNSQFAERAMAIKAGLMRDRGYSTLKLSYYNTNLGIVEGQRDTLTGDLLGDNDGRSYKLDIPFQKVFHYKAVSESFVNMENGHLHAILGFQHNVRQEYEESPDEYGLCLDLNTLNYDARYVSSLKRGWKYSTGVGGMLQKSLNKGTEFLVPDYGLADVGVFGTASKAVGRWNVSGGIRLDYRRLVSERLEDDGEVRFEAFNRSFSGVTGSVGATYTFNDRLAAKINIARGFRAPNISELASNGEHEGTLRYEIGDKTFAPEYSLQADFGIDYSNRFVSLQISAFANRIDNYIFARRIDSIVQPDFMTFAYVQGDAMLCGGEAAFDFHPIHSLHLGGAFSYVYTRLFGQSDDMKHLPLTPAPRLSLDLKWEISHSAQVLRNAFVSAQTDCYLEQNRIFEASGTETATPAYTLINISAGTDIFIKGKKIAQLAFFVNNVADVCCQNHLSRLKYADENLLTGRKGVFDMGRNVVLKLTVPFAVPLKAESWQ